MVYGTRISLAGTSRGSWGDPSGASWSPPGTAVALVVTLGILLGLPALRPAAALIDVGSALRFYCWDVEVVGQIAYIAASGSGLRIIDISNPDAPAVALGALDAEAENADDVEVVGMFDDRLLDVSYFL